VAVARGTQIERQVPSAGPGGAAGHRWRAAHLALGSLALAGVVLGTERLPAWSCQMAGVYAEVGPGRRVTAAGEPALRAPEAGPAVDTAGPPASGATRYTFATYAEAEEFAGKAGAHVRAPQWVPPGFVPEPLTVALGQLPPEAAAVTGRRQRVAVTQRYVAADGSGQFTIVQSLPPPLFDLLDPLRPDEEVALAGGGYARYGEFPQGVILYWRERGDTRSIGIIADQAAAARVTRAEWLRLAESMQ
jgi:hypothetical protein